MSAKRLASEKGVQGHDLPGQRFTIWAAVYFLGFFALPLLAVLGVADWGLYVFFRDVLKSCYGIGCLFG